MILKLNSIISNSILLNIYFINKIRRMSLERKLLPIISHKVYQEVIESKIRFPALLLIECIFLYHLGSASKPHAKYTINKSSLPLSKTKPEKQISHSLIS